MGQAKNRKAEIAQLKQTKRLVKILAIRHCADGQSEFAYFGAELPSDVRNSKNALLSHICLNNWLHTPPAYEIAEYLVQTDTFKEMKQFGVSAAAFEINFFERDTDPSGRSTHSCRMIYGIPDEAQAEQYINAKIEALKTEPGRSYMVHA